MSRTTKPAILHTLDYINTGCIILNTTLECIGINREGAAILGVDDIEFVGKTFSSDHPGHPAKSLFHAIKQAIKKNQHEYNTVITLQNNRKYSCKIFFSEQIISIFLENFHDKDAGNSDAGNRFWGNSEYYRSLFESNPLSMFVCDANTLKIVEMNNAAIQNYGYSRDEFLTMTLPQLSPEENENCYENKNRGAHKLKYGVCIAQHFKKDNESIDVVVNIRNFYYDGSFALLVIVNDITEQRKAEHAFNEATEDRICILESIGDAFFAVDNNDVVTYWNFQAEILLKTLREDIVGKKLWDVFSDAVNLKFYEEYQLSKELNTPIYFEEFLPRIKKWLDVSVYPANHGLSVFFRDITKRKEKELALEKLNRELKKNIEYRSQELNRSNKELEEISYSVSHELRTPLRAIDGFSLAISEEYSHLLDDTGKGYLMRVRAASQRLSLLFDDLINMVNISGKELNVKNVNISKLAEAMATILKQKNTERSVDVIIQPDIFVKADPLLIKIAIQHLIENAWKFTAEINEAYIKVGTEKDHGDTVYYVQDNGKGFNPRFIDKIFQPFQKLQNENESPGTGVGLAIVKRIIEKHRGTILVTSKENEGTVVSFTLHNQ